MRLVVKNTQGGDAGSVQVRDDIFDAPMNPAVVHQVAVGQRANARRGTASTKGRSSVSGSGRKPFPQKTTGRARQGSTRAPQLRGGGVVFGPQPRSFAHRTPKRMRRQSLVALLSQKVRDDELVVLESLDLEPPKTAEMVRVMSALGAATSVLLIADGADHAVLRAARNIPRLKMIPAYLLNTLDLLNHGTVVITVEAVRKVEEVWGAALDAARRPSVIAVAQS